MQFLLHLQLFYNNNICSGLLSMLSAACVCMYICVSVCMCLSLPQFILFYAQQASLASWLLSILHKLQMRLYKQSETPNASNRSIMYSIINRKLILSFLFFFLFQVSLLNTHNNKNNSNIIVSYQYGCDKNVHSSCCLVSPIGLSIEYTMYADGFCRLNRPDWLSILSIIYTICC